MREGRGTSLLEGNPGQILLVQLIYCHYRWPRVPWKRTKPKAPSPAFLLTLFKPLWFAVNLQCKEYRLGFTYWCNHANVGLSGAHSYNMRMSTRQFILSCYCKKSNVSNKWSILRSFDVVTLADVLPEPGPAVRRLRWAQPPIFSQCSRVCIHDRKHALDINVFGSPEGIMCS